HRPKPSRRLEIVRRRHIASRSVAIVDICLDWRARLINHALRVRLERRPFHEIAVRPRTDEQSLVRKKLVLTIEVECAESFAPARPITRITIDENQLRSIGGERRNHHGSSRKTPTSNGLSGDLGCNLSPRRSQLPNVVVTTACVIATSSS